MVSVAQSLASLTMPLALSVRTAWRSAFGNSGGAVCVEHSGQGGHARNSLLDTAGAMLAPNSCEFITAVPLVCGVNTSRGDQRTAVMLDLQQRVGEWLTD